MPQPMIQNNQYPNATEQELSIVLLYKQGLSTQAVATALSVGRNKVRAVCKKYDVMRSKSEGQSSRRVQAKHPSYLGTLSDYDKNERIESNRLQKGLDALHQIYSKNQQNRADLT